MSFFRIFLTFLCAAVLLESDRASGASSAAANYVEGEVIVTFRPAVDRAALTGFVSGHSLTLATHYEYLSEVRGQHTALVRAQDRTTAALLDELRQDPQVETVDPNYLRYPLGGAPPNDTMFGQLWGLQNTGQTVQGVAGTSGADIKFIGAWKLARPSTNSIVVAVVDSGVDYTHPDLAGNMWINPGEIANNGVDDDHNGYVDDYFGYNFADHKSDPMAVSEHGTHVAGTIAAIGNNKLGVIGVNYRAKIMALRVSSDGVTMVSSAIIEAVQYAAMMKGKGVNVVAINASYGGGGFSSSEQSSIQAAGNAGIVFCAAAGNDSANNDSITTYPASYRLPNMMVVAASDQKDALASFSNYGAGTVDLAAPGVSVLSTTPPGMTSFVQVATSGYTADALEYAGTTTGLTGAIYYCGLGYPTNFPSGVRSNLALISRGTLYFSQKVSNAMAAGATGVIIYNNTNVPFTGTLGSAGNWIPAVLISQADGLLLKASLPATGTMFSAVSSNAIYQYLDGTSMATPHVVGAVAFAAMNFPSDTVAQRIQRILTNVDSVPGLAGKVITGGRLNLLRTVDANGNGLPDWWEQKYFGAQANVNPAADPDTDGQNNLQEYLADTNPLDANSKVRVAGVKVGVGGTQVSWSLGTESRQFLQRSSSPTGPWTDIWTNEPPTGTNVLFLDTSITNKAGYYRLRLERP